MGEVILKKFVLPSVAKIAPLNEEGQAKVDRLLKDMRCSICNIKGECKCQQK